MGVDIKAKMRASMFEAMSDAVQSLEDANQIDDMKTMQHALEMVNLTVALAAQIARTLQAMEG